MVNYAELAGKAKAMQDANKFAVDRQREVGVDPSALFERVKAHLVEEMNKANIELRKIGAETIGRNHSPSFDGKFCLTYGTSLLCSVELEAQAGRCRIKASISGPPNGYEISRKEYLFNLGASGFTMLQAGRVGLPAAEARPDEVAVDIVSGFLAGKFD